MLKEVEQDLIEDKIMEINHKVDKLRKWKLRWIIGKQ